MKSAERHIRRAVRSVLREEAMDWNLNTIVSVPKEDLRYWMATGKSDLSRLQVQRDQIVYADRTDYKDVYFKGVDRDLAERIVRNKVGTVGAFAGRDIVADVSGESRYQVSDASRYIQELWVDEVLGSGRYVDHDRFFERKARELKDAIRRYAAFSRASGGGKAFEYKSASFEEFISRR